MKRQFIVILAFVLLFSGCDALKSLYGEIYGEDGGPAGGGNSGGSGFGGEGGSGSSGGSGSGGGDGSGGSSGGSAAFQGVTVDGDGTTTLVSLVFDRDIPGLSENDITVIDLDDKTGAVKGVLSPAGLEGIYTLGIAGVREPGEITVRVGKNGWTVNPASRPAQVYYDPVAVPVTFASAMANGTAGSATTDALTLAFNMTIANLSADDITLSAGSTGATKGGLVDTGGGTYTLELNNVTAAGEITVTVSKNGYTVNPATSSPVQVHYYPVFLATGGTVTFLPVEDNPSLIWEIHTFTANGTLDFGGVPPNLTARALVVAGGGGGGLSQDSLHPAGGGGAGGYIYVPSFPIQNGLFTVKVGAGGAKPASYGSPNGSPNATKGATGGDSEFGGIIAKGGGGGASHAGASSPGASGGSGGGSSWKGAGGGATPGTVPAGIQNAEILGNRGGNITGEQGSTGTGGGGAGGTGGDTASTYQSTPGGAGTMSGISGQEREYARGGNAGGDAGADGAANTGNGGKGGTGTSGNGGSGIVVVRFQRPAAVN
jgi:hypothetical protein